MSGSSWLGAERPLGAAGAGAGGDGAGEGAAAGDPVEAGVENQVSELCAATVRT